MKVQSLNTGWRPLRWSFEAIVMITDIASLSRTMRVTNSSIEIGSFPMAWAVVSSRLDDPTTRLKPSHCGRTRSDGIAFDASVDTVSVIGLSDPLFHLRFISLSIPII